MEKEKTYSLNGPDNHIAKWRTVRELPFNFNPINNIAFIDAPTDYILLAKLTEKTNEIISAINNLNAAMDEFYQRVDAQIEQYTINRINELMASGAITLNLAYNADTKDLKFSLTTNATEEG